MHPHRPKHESPRRINIDKTICCTETMNTNPGCRRTMMIIVMCLLTESMSSSVPTIVLSIIGRPGHLGRWGEKWRSDAEQSCENKRSRTQTQRSTRNKRNPESYKNSCVHVMRTGMNVQRPSPPLFFAYPLIIIVSTSHCAHTLNYPSSESIAH